MHKSSHILKTAIVAFGLAALILAPMTRAMAGRRDNDDSRYRHYNYNRHYDNDRRYAHRRYDNRRYRHYRYGGYHRGRHGNVALGILTGGLLFYALTSNNRRYYNNRTIYVRERPIYVQPTTRRWIARPRPRYAANSCLQTREYQTTITIGGQNVPAYGQSCLQPDGTWKLGPATPEPGN